MTNQITEIEESRPHRRERVPSKGLLLRVPPDVHEALRRIAFERRVSINSLASGTVVALAHALCTEEKAI